MTEGHINSAVGWEKSFSFPVFLAREDGSVIEERHSLEPSSAGVGKGLTGNFNLHIFLSESVGRRHLAIRDWSSFMNGNFFVDACGCNLSSEPGGGQCKFLSCAGLVVSVITSLQCRRILGRVNAIAAILDSKRRGRLGRVERTTKILQIQHGGYDQPTFWHSRFPGKRLHCRLRCYRTQLYGRLLNYEYNYFTKHFKAP